METQVSEELKLNQQLKNGASWFYWIAGLSLINSAVIHFGGSWSFLIGLGITQFIDAVSKALSEEIGNAISAIAFLIDLFVAGIFITIGYFANKRHNWSFILGMILYALDGLLFLAVKDFLSFGFHAFALIWIFNGSKASKKLTALELQKLTRKEPGTGGIQPVALTLNNR